MQKVEKGALNISPDVSLLKITLNSSICNCDLEIIPLQENVNRPKKRIVEFPSLWMFIFLHLSDILQNIRWTVNSFKCPFFLNIDFISGSFSKTKVGKIFPKKMDRNEYDQVRWGDKGNR